MRRCLLFLFWASVLSWGQGSVSTGTPIVIDQNGHVIQNAAVAVCLTNPGVNPAAPCANLATLYTDVTLSVACTGAAASQPLNNSANPSIGAGCSNPGLPTSGNVVAYSTAGLYWCEYYGSGFSTIVQPCNFPANNSSGVFGLVNVGDIATGSIFQGYGDSFAACFNVTPSSCWQNVFATEKALTLNNQGVSSTGVADNGQFGLVVQLANTAPYLNYGYCCAVNDMRNNLTAGEQLVWQQSYEALLWWLATPEVNKIRSTSSSITYSGTWSLPPSNYSGNMNSTIAGGSTASFTVHGKDVIVIGGYQVSNSSTWNVTIDGSYTTPTVTTGTNAFSTVQFNQNFGPTFVHQTGLVEKDHNVVFTCVAASAGNPCYFIAGGTSFGVGATGPAVYALETTKLETSPNDGYSVTSVNCPVAPCGSDALVAQFDMLEAQAINDLHNMGLSILQVPLNTIYQPNTTVTQSDGVHPNNTGSTLIGQGLILAAKGYLTPMDRGASSTLSDLNPCIANASGGSLFAIGGLGNGVNTPCVPGMQRGDAAFSEFETIGKVFFGHDGLGSISRNGSLFTFGASGAGASISALGFISTTPTGSAPFTVTSTTPVANLNTSPVTYEISGTQDANPHLVRGFCTLGSNCSITLVGSAIFSATANYNCIAQDETAAAATKVVRSSASAFVLTGTGTDNLSYVCVGF